MSRSGAQYVAQGMAWPALRAGGNFYLPQITVNLATTANPADGRAFFVPFFVPNAGISFDRIGVRTTVAATAGGLARLGIYDNTGAQGPGALILDAGTIAADAAPGAMTITIAQALPIGLYWLTMAAQGAAATQATYLALNGVINFLPSTSMPTSGSPSGGWQSLAAAIPGALPLNAPAGMIAPSVVPVTMLRTA